MSTKYIAKIDPPLNLEEQLRLFAFNGSPLPSNNSIDQIKATLSKRDILSILLQGDLNFHGESSSYASHDLHAFAAKFPPQLPRSFIRGLTGPGDIVLDPMMGSGTTLVEAHLEGRQGIGFDIDPLSLRLGIVKTSTLDPNLLREKSFEIISKANSFLINDTEITHHLELRFDEKTKSFVDYWFFPDTQRELMAIILSIEEIYDPLIRFFFELTFSSIIITKSGGVSLARDLAHSRPHLDKTKIPKNAIQQFIARIKKNLNSIAQIKSKGYRSNAVFGDARCMPIKNGSVDLIVTSPPYANAIDYMRAHKFSLVWLGGTVSYLAQLRSSYIGSERQSSILDSNLPERPEKIINKLSEKDHSKSKILKKYFIEMKYVIREMYRVLRDNSPAIIIVGPSIMRDIDVQTHYCLADIAFHLGFDVIGVVKRALDRNKRMMPARFGKKSDSMIEQRMHEEYVIGLLKPDSKKGEFGAYT